MIDRNARSELAEILKLFMAGEITNYNFEDKVPESDDPAIMAIFSSVWCLYDDFKEHKLSSGDRVPEEMLARWLVFLDSSEEYGWPAFPYPGLRPLDHGLISKILGHERKELRFMASGDYDVWPFLTRESYSKVTENRRGQGRRVQ